MSGPGRTRVSGFRRPPACARERWEREIAVLPGPRPARESRLPNWPSIQGWARLELARFRALPRTDVWAQVREGCWPNPTPAQRKHLELMERWSQ
jgi:hypothetical protein